MTKNTTRMPLHGVRILDMATVLAAPFSATLCGDMGADVVKLELPNSKDPLRSLEPIHNGHSVFWKTANRGKKGISLDVRQPEGREIFLKLIEKFDVLVENFRTGTLDRWGLGLDVLHERNPKLIVLRLTGFGQDGPYARRPGFARTFEAMSGFVHLLGEADGPPQHMNYPLGDVIAGLFGAFAISTALAERNAQPLNQQRGCEIDLSATEALFRLLDPLPAEYALTGVARGRAGSRATYTAPSNVYQSADGAWLTMSGTSNPMFQNLCRAIERADWLEDERFSTTEGRTENLIELDDAIADWCRTRNIEKILATLQKCDVPHSKIYSCEDILADPGFRERGSLIELQDPALGSLPVPAPVPRFPGRTVEVPSVGPENGEHNSQIYAEIGLSNAELESLRANRTI